MRTSTCSSCNEGWVMWWCFAKPKLLNIYDYILFFLE
jgi:hypothetical protein